MQKKHQVTLESNFRAVLTLERQESPQENNGKGHADSLTYPETL